MHSCMSTEPVLCEVGQSAPHALQVMMAGGEGHIVLIFKVSGLFPVSINQVVNAVRLSHLYLCDSAMYRDPICRTDVVLIMADYSLVGYSAQPSVTNCVLGHEM